MTDEEYFAKYDYEGLLQRANPEVAVFDIYEEAVAWAESKIFGFEHWAATGIPNATADGFVVTLNDSYDRLETIAFDWDGEPVRLRLKRTDCNQCGATIKEKPVTERALQFCNKACQDAFDRQYEIDAEANEAWRNRNDSPRKAKSPKRQAKPAPDLVTADAADILAYMLSGKADIPLSADDCHSAMKTTYKPGVKRLPRARAALEKLVRTKQAHAGEYLMRRDDRDTTAVYWPVVLGRDFAERADKHRQATFDTFADEMEESRRRGEEVRRKLDAISERQEALDEEGGERDSLCGEWSAIFKAHGAICRTERRRWMRPHREWINREMEKAANADR